MMLKGAVFHIVFTDANQLPPPYRIDNMSEVPILFYQSRTEEHQRCLLQPKQSGSILSLLLRSIIVIRVKILDNFDNLSLSPLIALSFACPPFSYVLGISPLTLICLVSQISPLHMPF